MLNVLMVLDKLEEVRDFGNTFYTRVMDRLRAAGRPDLKNHNLNILVSGVQTEAEQERYLSLSPETTIWEFPDDFQIPVTEAELEAIAIQNLGNEKGREYIRLRRKLEDEKMNGLHDPIMDRLVLRDSLRGNPSMYSVAAHEILHRIRNQVVNRRETHNGYSKMDRALSTLLNTADNVVDGADIEFFAMLDSIVRADVMKEDPKFPGADKPMTATCNVGDVLEFMANIDQNYIQSIIEWGYQGYAILGQEDINRARNDFGEVGDFLISGIKYANIANQVDAEMAPHIKNQMVNFAHAVGFYTNPKNPRKLKDKDARMLMFTERFIGSMFDQAELGITAWDRSHEYNVARTAIGTNEEDLKKNWAEVFLMKTESVRELYIKPIRKKLDKLA